MRTQWVRAELKKCRGSGYELDYIFVALVFVALGQSSTIAYPSVSENSEN